MCNEVALRGSREDETLPLCIMPALGRGFRWTMLVETRLQGGEDVDEGRVPCTIYAKGCSFLVI